MSFLSFAKTNWMHPRIRNEPKESEPCGELRIRFVPVLTAAFSGKLFETILSIQKLENLRTCCHNEATRRWTIFKYVHRPGK